MQADNHDKTATVVATQVDTAAMREAKAVAGKLGIRTTAAVARFVIHQWASGRSIRDAEVLATSQK